MGVLTKIITKGAKYADNLFDAADTPPVPATPSGITRFDPNTAPNVQDMTASEIRAELDLDGIPGWRRTDLQRQLTFADELEEAATIRSAGDDELSRISLDDRAVSNPRYATDNPLDFEDMKSWLFDEVWNPPAPVRREIYSGTDALPYGDAPRPTYEHGSLLDTSGFNPSHYLSRAVRGAPWADPSEIKRAKQLAKDLEASTGVPMEVDHLIPLKGDFVSGLHHQDNLFVMPAVENRIKNNSFDFDDYVSIQKGAHRTTSNEKHADFLANNKRLVAERQEKKSTVSKQFSDQLDQQILDPNTKIGKNARALWGSDSERILRALKNIEKQRVNG